VLAPFAPGFLLLIAHGGGIRELAVAASIHISSNLPKSYCMMRVSKWSRSISSADTFRVRTGTDRFCVRTRAKPKTLVPRRTCGELEEELEDLPLRDRRGTTPVIGSGPLQLSCLWLSTRSNTDINTGSEML
jgi:hypothetical protein